MHGSRSVLGVVVVVLVVGGCDCAPEPIVTIDREGGEGQEGEGEEGEGEGEGVGEGEGEPSCDASVLTGGGGADKARVLLLGMSFTEVPGVDGTLVRALNVDDGVITAATDELDVGFRVARIAFVPSGRFAVVVGEDGGVVSVDVGDPAALAIVDREQLPAFGVGDVHVHPTPRGDSVVVYVINADVDAATAGVSVLTLGCDGQLAVDDDARLGLRLSSSLAFLPGDRALLLGGQVTGFEPRDEFDLRLLSLTGAPTQIGAFDVVTDFVDATRIAAARTGSFAVIPNSSAFSAEAGDVVVVDIVGDVVSERGRAPGFVNASEAVIAPDLSVAAVSVWEDDSVLIFDVTGAGAPTLITRLGNLGLAEQMAMLERGAHAGRVFVPIVSPAGGSFVVAVDVGAGTGIRGAEFLLGDAIADIPVAVAVQP